MAQQLTLGVGLSDHADFDNFFDGANAEAVSFVRAVVVGEGLVVLYGGRGSGKTHLLYAAQKRARENGRTAFYFSLADEHVRHDAFADPGPGALICVDDIQARTGVAAYERGLLALIEAQRAHTGALILAADRSPRELGLVLADVTSRLNSGACYRMHLLNDSEMEQALLTRAHSRGFELSSEVVQYVMTRYTRDPAALIGLLDRIDTASLSAQRKVTIPFLRELENKGD